MPRKPATPSLADEHGAPGGAAAVDRAITLLGLFAQGGGPFTLSTMAERARLYKSTVLRLLASLEHSGLILRQPDGRYALGPMVAQLHASYTASFSLEAVVMPALRELVARTSESAAFHVRQGDHRLCLYRVDSPQPVRDHIKVGDLMPLGIGSGGRVLQAFAGAPGELYDRIRREHVAVLQGDRVPELAGVSAPVFDASGALVGAVTLTMPKERLVDTHPPCVIAAARSLTQRLGGRFHAPNAGLS
jgi:DNA-binding IclR family transcriptional regulator